MKKLFVLVAAIFATSVYAAPADDLDCDKCVDATELAPNSVAGRHLKDGMIGTEKLANRSVTQAKLASQSVSSGKIQDGAVNLKKLDDGVMELITSTGQNRLLLVDSNGAVLPAQITGTDADRVTAMYFYEGDAVPVYFEAGDTEMRSLLMEGQDLYFSGADCTGDAYINALGNTPLRPENLLYSTIVPYMGKVYAVDNSSDPGFSVSSRLRNDTGQCTNGEPSIPGRWYSARELGALDIAFPVVVQWGF